MKCDICGKPLRKGDPYLETPHSAAHIECVEDKLYDLLDGDTADRICQMLWTERMTWDEDEVEADFGECKQKYTLYADEDRTPIRIFR